MKWSIRTYSPPYQRSWTSAGHGCSAATKNVPTAHYRISRQPNSNAGSSQKILVWACARDCELTTHLKLPALEGPDLRYVEPVSNRFRVYVDSLRAEPSSVRPSERFQLIKLGEYHHLFTVIRHSLCLRKDFDRYRFTHGQPQNIVNRLSYLRSEEVSALANMISLQYKRSFRNRSKSPLKVFRSTRP